MSKDFTREQEERIDEVMEKVDEFTEYLAPGYKKTTTIQIGELADAIAEFLTDIGCKVYFPIHIIDGDYEEISDIWK